VADVVFISAAVVFAIAVAFGWGQDWLTAAMRRILAN
jgi:hypothetical protein